MKIALRATRSVSRRVALVCSAALLAACSSSDIVTSPSGPGAATTLQLSTNGVALNGIGASDSIHAVVRDAAGVATGGTVTWTSEDPTIAVVVANGSTGAIVARAAGVTRVRATSGALTSDVEVRVFGVRSIALVQSVLTLRTGDAQTLGLVVDADASASQQVQFSTSNPAVATVTAGGLVSAVTPGTATVTVTSTADPRLTASAVVTVNPARTVSFAPGSTALTLWLGDARALEALVDVDETESRDIVWSSENPAVATVNENGVLVAIGEGTAIIRATSAADARASAEMVLTVLPARRVVVTPESIQLTTGAQAQFVAAMTTGSGLADAVVWLSSDSTVARVSASGVVTAGATGVATITAVSVTDPSRSGTGIVTVSDLGTNESTGTRGTSGRTSRGRTGR